MHPGGVQMLSYTVSTFDTQLVFPLHGEDFNEKIRSGAMRKRVVMRKVGVVDPLALVCKQLATALWRFSTLLVYCIETSSQGIFLGIAGRRRRAVQPLCSRTLGRRAW